MFTGLSDPAIRSRRVSGRPAPDGPKFRMNLTLDLSTIDRLKAIQASRPELDSMSATVRYLSRHAPQEFK